ncbi:hypothetical protein STW0522RAO56_46170 [Raoultella planticola]|nr:hypothetical protein STW0522RAO56_46170 [Raoultella planticola]
MADIKKLIDRAGRAGLWHWRCLFPGGALLTGATGGCGAWLDRLAHRLRGACGTGVVCSPVALRLPGLRAWCGVWLYRLAYCPRGACGTGVVCSPVALRLPGLRAWCGVWLDRLAHRPAAGLWHWRRLLPGGTALTGATGMVRCLALSPGALPAGGLWHWRRLLPGGAVLTGATGGAVSGFIAWRIACGGPVALAPFAPRWRCAYRGYGWCGVWLYCLAHRPAGGLWHWHRLLPGGAALTGATGGAVPGLIAWRIACGGPVALVPFAPRWHCAYRATGGGGVWLYRLAHCLRGACGTGAVCSPVALRLPGLRGCGVWLYRLAHCLWAGLWHWRRLLPGGAALTGATDMVRCWGFSPGVSLVGEL